MTTRSDTREVRLGRETIELIGTPPQIGDRLCATFRIPPARHADRPLTTKDLVCGLVFVSTLPNIEKHACMAQIVALDEEVSAHWRGARAIHVSADADVHWREVDQFHPDIRAAAYSLCCADHDSREAFTRAFGVGVVGHRRIAHGLFALQDGRFVAAMIPTDQMQPVDVSSFAAAVTAGLSHNAMGAGQVKGG
ncbi:MAG: hypothetical protein U0172_00800 [Nitrospiraceae bacterium]